MAKKKWTPHKRQKAIEMYIQNKDIAEIAKTIGIADQTVRIELNAIVKGMINARLTRTKHGNQWNNASDDLRLSNPALLEEEFQELLSEPDDPVLSKAEEKFVWAYATSGDYVNAAMKAGFDHGYYTMEEIKGGKRGEKKRVYAESYVIGVKLRIAALRMKPNVKERLEELEGNGIFDSTQVNKPYLQRVILRQLDNLDFNNPDDKKLHRDYTQMLGRTFGGFTEKLEIGMVDHKKSVRKLAEISGADDLAMLRAKKEMEKQQDAVTADGMDS